MSFKWVPHVTVGCPSSGLCQRPANTLLSPLHRLHLSSTQPTQVLRLSMSLLLGIITIEMSKRAICHFTLAIVGASSSGWGFRAYRIKTFLHVFNFFYYELLMLLLSSNSLYMPCIPLPHLELNRCQPICILKTVHKA